MARARLQQLDDDLWVGSGEVADRMPGPLKKYDFPTRMTVIRLADSGLFLHSPVRLDSELRTELDALGPVRVIVAPNRFHHLFAGEYKSTYLDARLYGALGLQSKRKDLRFFAMLGDEPRAEWKGQVEQLLFKGAPLLNEVVFFHRASRTLLLTDLAFNMPPGTAWGVPFIYRLTAPPGGFGPTRLTRWAIRDRKAAYRSLRRILEWDFDRVIVGHGEIVETGGRARLENGFAFLFE
jgi:hypothetical protein